METFYLIVEVQKTQAELMEGQPERCELEFATAQEVVEAAQGICNLIYYNRPAKAYLLTNRHSAAGNEPCTKELIYEQ